MFAATQGFMRNCNNNARICAEDLAGSFALGRKWLKPMHEKAWENFEYLNRADADGFQLSAEEESQMKQRYFALLQMVVDFKTAHNFWEGEVPHYHLADFTNSFAVAERVWMEMDGGL